MKTTYARLKFRFLFALVRAAFACAHWLIKAIGPLMRATLHALATYHGGNVQLALEPIERDQTR